MKLGKFEFRLSHGFLALSYAFLVAVCLYILVNGLWRTSQPEKEARRVSAVQHTPSVKKAITKSEKKAAYDRHFAAAIAERDWSAQLCRTQGGIPIPGYNGAVVCVYQYPNGGGHAHAAEAKIDWPTDEELKEALE